MTKKTPYIIIAFSIAGILSVLSYFDAYDYIENLLLDLRFKSRGRMETRSVLQQLTLMSLLFKRKVNGTLGAEKNTSL